MAHESLRRKTARFGLALWMATMTTLAPVASTARAQFPSDDAPTALSCSAPSDDPGDPDRWWGAAGAALCGLELRLMMRVPAIGFNPYAIAAGLSGCLLAALDITH